MSTESIRGLVSRLESLNEQELTKAHVEHPEDLVFHTGGQGAQQGL